MPALKFIGSKLAGCTEVELNNQEKLHKNKRFVVSASPIGTGNYNSARIVHMGVTVPRSTNRTLFGWGGSVRLGGK
jgi:hypothetical protein